MNKFWGVVIVLKIIIPVDVFGAFVAINLHNALTGKITLVPQEDIYTGFEEQEICCGKDKCLNVDITDYKPADSLEKSKILSQINAVVRDEIVGAILLMQGISPNPFFYFGNSENSLGCELHIQRSRFGGGPMTMEVVRATER